MFVASLSPLRTLQLIPFLYELRMLLDWTCVPTTLYLTQWYQMEDINGQLYMNQYNNEMIAWERRPLGQRQPLWRKLLLGVLFVALLIFLLWFPLLAISLINQRALPNVPERVSVTLTVNSYQPLFVMDNLAPTPSISDADYEQLRLQDASGFVATYRSPDVQRMLLSPLSKQIWGISPSSRESLVQALEEDSQPVTLTVGWSFYRADRNGIAVEASGNREYQPANSTDFRLQLLSALAGNGSVDLPQLLPSFYKLGKTDATTTGDGLPGKLGEAEIDCLLSRFSDPMDPSIEWWALNQTSPHVVSLGICGRILRRG